MQLDAVIFGGGAAGLWLLDELCRRGRSVVLLEAGELGSGQTIASQGIIHGGLKYTLQGLWTASAASISEMPLIWRECLAGRRLPSLTQTRVRAHSCYLWRSDRMASRLGMIGARFGLRVTPQAVSDADRPGVLAACPGTVARLAEQVISPADFLSDLAGRHWERILKIDSNGGLDFVCDRTAADGTREHSSRHPPCAVRHGTRSVPAALADGSGRVPATLADGTRSVPATFGVRTVRLKHPRTGETLELLPHYVVFTAGAGNADLRQRVGLSSPVMQRRPLHMVMLRGDLPVLNGHCVDGAKTRVTITSDTDSQGRMVWQVGGQIAEDGVPLDGPSLIAHARSELKAVLPGLDLSGAEWATYRIDRSEGTTPSGKRPETFQILEEGNTITAWPTKLALAPQLADAVAARLDIPAIGHSDVQPLPADWPRPKVALPPWETCEQWSVVSSRRSVVS